MTDKNTEVVFAQVKDCNFCELIPLAEPDLAVVDGKTDSGAWAYMCQAHYNLHGVGIGLGKGQAIIYKLAKADCGCCGLYADDDIE